jgi:ATP-binding cassette subfamily F protein 3
LQDYQGAMIVVSHDRHLLRSVTDQLLLVANGEVQPFDGDLDDYKNWLAEQKKQDNAANNAVVENSNNVSRKDQRKLDAERRKQNKPLFDALKKAELAVERYHSEQKQIEQQLAEPDIYNDCEKARLKQLLERKVIVDKALEEAEMDWLDAQEKVEALE